MFSIVNNALYDIMTRYNNYTKHKQKVNRNYNKLGIIHIMRGNVMYCV